MSKPIIAIDIDDVLVDSAAAVLAAYNAEWGTNATLADYYVKPDPAIWKVGTMEEVLARVQAHQSSLEFFELPPIAAAIAGMQELAEHYELHAVTGRWDDVMEPTRRWLDQHFSGVVASLTSSNFHHPDKVRSKGAICLEIGASYLIDDHIKHCDAAVERGLKAVLFGDYPWTRNQPLQDGITRCKDWAAVLRYFESERASAGQHGRAAVPSELSGLQKGEGAA